MVLGGLFDTFSSLGESLSSEARRALIRSNLPALIEAGYSGNQSLEIFRNAGFGIGRGSFFEIHREVLGIEQQENRIRFVNTNSVPSFNVFADSSIDLPSDYRFIMKYTSENSITGREETHFINYDTNFFGTIGDIENDALTDIAERYSQTAGRITSISTWKAFTND